jgi:hypothetical protein
MTAKLRNCSIRIVEFVILLADSSSGTWTDEGLCIYLAYLGSSGGNRGADDALAEALQSAKSSLVN